MLVGTQFLRHRLLTRAAQWWTGIENALYRAMRFAVWVCLSAIPSSSCLVRTRAIIRPGHLPSGPLETATINELIQRVHNFADPIQSFVIRMDMSPSVGSLYEGEIKDYATL